MGNTEIIVNYLIMQSGKSASEITHALKSLGGGDGMAGGILKIAVHCRNEGFMSGRIEGIAVGICLSALVAIPLIFIAIDQKEKNRKLMLKSEAILNRLKAGLADYAKKTGSDSFSTEII